MLQQTQVDRVVPYFERWIKKFPTARALAKATLSEVLKEWSGLGYNRRAKLLRECAIQIVEKHGGKVPKDFAALVSLPAIGPYTAGAIRAFAFDEPEIFIETNIRAALIHHFFPNSRKVSDARLMPILEFLLYKSDVHNKNMKINGRQIGPREWYSALMDYGAHIKRTNPNPSRRSKHFTKQSKFKGSLRQARGAILRRLLDGPTSEKSFQNKNLKARQLFGLALRTLEKEGLIMQKRDTWRIV